MSDSQPNILKMDDALSAVPLDCGFDAKPADSRLFSTALPELDGSLGGGIRPGSFLARGCRRSSQIVKESGGLFVITAIGMPENTSDAAWINIPDYIIRASAGAYSLAKSPAAK
jgi:hypothetical protein